MKTIVAFCLSFLFVGSVASAQQLTKRDKVERILTLTRVSGDAITAQIKNMMTAAMPSAMPPEQKARMQEANQKIETLMKTVAEKMRPLYVDLYAETFTDQEIDGMLAFYESTAGKAMIDKQPLIMSKVMAALMPEIQRLAKEAAAN
jgi:uncharacterized protein